MPTAPATPLTATRAPRPLRGAMHLPGDAIIGRWALAAAGLAVGESRISELPDLPEAITCLQALGVTVMPAPDGGLRVFGRGVGGLAEPQRALQVGSSAEWAMMLAGMLASHPVFAVLDGPARRDPRNWAQMHSLLARTGANLLGRSGGGLPLAIKGADDARPLEVELKRPSARVKAMLLLCGLNAGGQTRIVEPERTHDHGEVMLRRFGARVESEPAGRGQTIVLRGQPELRGCEVTVPGDITLASLPLLAALVVPGSSVTLPAVGLNPTRTATLDVMRAMGASVAGTATDAAEPFGDLVAEHGALRAVTTAWEMAPAFSETYPILAALAATAVGTSRFVGLGSVGRQAPDRLARVAAALRHCGVAAETEGEDLLVTGQLAPPAGGAQVAVGDDGWLAMACLTLGLVAAAPIAIDDGGGLLRVFPGAVTAINALADAVWRPR